MEITKQLEIDEYHGQILNNHSILNILNLLQFNFLRLSDILNDDKALLRSYGSVQELALLVSRKSVGEAEGCEQGCSGRPRGGVYAGSGDSQHY